MSTASQRPTRAELVERARVVGAELADGATKTEELRRLPEETVLAFRESGLLRAFVPEAYGGYALEIATVIETAREVGEHCGSSAWCLAIFSLHNWMVSNFPAAAQQEVFGDSPDSPDSVVCGVFMPGGTVVPSEGGYRLSGQWDFASGCDHAGHAILSALIQGGPEGEVSGLGSFLVRRADLAIEDNWFVAGLQGTGSKRVVVSDVFVPEDWFLPLTKGPGADVAAGSRGAADGTVALPFNSVATLGLVGVTLGIARGALENFRLRLGTKVRVGSFRRAEAQVGAQHRLAESAAEIDGAELIALRDAEEMEASRAAGEMASLEQRGRYRRDAAYVFQVCARAVARLLPASGAHAIFRDAIMQRAVRDTQAMSAHIVADWDLARESYARVLLEMPTEDPVF